MGDSRVTALAQRQSQLEVERSNYEVWWRYVADVIRPLRNAIREQRTPGDRRHETIFDSSPLMALAQFGAGVAGQLTNPANEWFSLSVAGDEDLSNYGPVKSWLHDVSKVTLQSFSPAFARYYQQMLPFYLDLGAFGTAFFWSEEVLGTNRFYDVCVPIEQMWIGAGAWGEIDIFHRKWRPTAYEIMGFFGEDTPARIRKAVEKDGQPLQRFELLHATEPNADYVEGRLGPAGMPIKSTYAWLDEEVIIREAGHYERPWACARWSVAGTEIWGRGQGEVALADSRTTQKMQRSNLMAGERAANPAMLAPNRSKLAGDVNNYPGKTMYGAVSPDGRQLVYPLGEGGNPPFSLEMQEQVINRIKDAFVFSTLQQVADKQMTLGEFAGRERHRRTQFGPHASNIENEALSPQITRRIGILGRQDRLPPMPPELLDADGIETVFQSPAAQAQKLQKAEGALQTVEGMTMAAQLDPSVIDKFDGDAYMDLMGEAFGASEVIRSDDDTAAIREGRRMREQMQQAADAAPGVGRAMKDGVEAVKAANAA